MNFASVSDLAIRFWSNSDSVLFFCFSFYCGGITLIAFNRIGGVMVSVLDTHVVDHGFKSGKTRVNAFFFFRYSRITVTCNRKANYNDKDV